jgi:hypothetical protein
MYVVIVLGQTLVLPLVSGFIELSVVGGDPVLVFGRWWIVWGVGSRLLLAGLSQLFVPERTAAILGSDGTAAERVLARELGVANVAMGLAGLLALNPAWIVPAGAAGAVFLGIAGLNHVAKPGKSTHELVATWTDLLVAAVYLVVVARIVLG